MASLFALACACAVLLRATPARAHPLLEERIEVSLHDQELTLRLHGTVKAMTLAVAREPKKAPFYERSELKEALRDYVPYLREHLRVAADDQPLALQIDSFGLDDEAGPPVHRLMDQETAFVHFELVAHLPRAPSHITLTQNMLTDVADPSGQQWSVTYVVAFGEAVAALPPNAPLTLDLRARPSTFASFVKLGAVHIATGLDHLLFLAAVALRARSLRSLALVIVAFTLAHTTTLALAMMGWVRLPAGIVEAGIGLSIVAAALPSTSTSTSTWTSTAVAFAFGLIHGLGFAGGLSDALGPNRDALVPSLLGFTLGIELVQQALVLPTFLAAAWLRARDARAPWLQRLAFAIAALGLLFVFQALRAVMRGS